MMAATANIPNPINTPNSSDNNIKANVEDSLQLLEKLHGLMTKGVISEVEFLAKKADILSKM